MKNIDIDKVKVTNYSERELTLEFIDFLIGNAREVLKDDQILENIGAINASHVAENNDGVILSVKDANGKILNLFFSGGDKFPLTHSQEAGDVRPA